LKYLDEYRDSQAALKYAEAITRITTKPWTIMEVCGGQTHAILKHGIDQLLPDKRFLTLPGTLSISPKEQKITSSFKAIVIALSIISIGVTHTGQPGP